MATLFIFCALALFIQAITCQCIGNALNSGHNFNGLPFGSNFGNSLAGSGLANSGLAGLGYGAGQATGGGFTVTSTSPIAPTGVSVLAENLAIEGPLSVGGQMPFLGTVGIEGALPAIGSGAVSYGCGAGNIGITNEGLGLGGPNPYSLAGQAYGPGLAGPYGSGLANAGYGQGMAGAGYGPGMVGPSYGPAGPGLAGPGIGNGLNGPGFGAGLAGLGLGYNGVNNAGAVLK